MTHSIKASMKIGAATGGILFLIFGIIPGFYIGGFGTLILLQKLMGGSVEPTLFVRATIVMGILVGIVCAAVICLMVGGLLGTILGYVVSAPAVKLEKQAVVKK
jgi:hypothetical protein